MFWIRSDEIHNVWQILMEYLGGIVIRQTYLARGDLNVQLLGRGFAWLDTGTHESLMEAAEFVRTVEKRQGLKVACLEEIGIRNGWLRKPRLQREADLLGKTEYGRYLQSIHDEAN